MEPSGSPIRNEAKRKVYGKAWDSVSGMQGVGGITIARYDIHILRRIS